MLGKSIRIYLADASVSGIKHAELVNWTGQAISCPRSRLPELSKWPEVSRPGIYFLFEGKHLDEGALAYIGESENVYQRLSDHDRKKEFWQEVVVFSSKDENLTKSHIKYLESNLVTTAITAGRCKLENGNSPPESALPRADRDSMQEFKQNIGMILGVLGYPILEPILQTRISEEVSALITDIDQDATISSFPELTLKIGDLVAKGNVTDEGFVLRSGSEISLNPTESIPNNAKLKRETIIAEKHGEQRGKYFVLSKDFLVSSSSLAADIVAGYSKSGPQSWKDSNGNTLKELEERALKGGIAL